MTGVIGKIKRAMRGQVSYWDNYLWLSSIGDFIQISLYKDHRLLLCAAITFSLSIYIAFLRTLIVRNDNKIQCHPRLQFNVRNTEVCSKSVAVTSLILVVGKDTSMWRAIVCARRVNVCVMLGVDWWVNSCVLYGWISDIIDEVATILAYSQSGYTWANFAFIVNCIWTTRARRPLPFWAACDNGDLENVMKNGSRRADFMIVIIVKHGWWNGAHGRVPQNELVLIT